LSAFFDTKIDVEFLKLSSTFQKNSQNSPNSRFQKFQSNKNKLADDQKKVVLTHEKMFWQNAEKLVFSSMQIKLADSDFWKSFDKMPKKFQKQSLKLSC
jgi:hypothetical protein